MTDLSAATGGSIAVVDDDETVVRLTVIREAGLFVDDPETIPDRHHPIPTGMEPVRLLKDYDTSRTTGRKVRCSACAHHQYHNRGFVAEMPDGRPALIGINCGERHFGDGEWDRMHADLRREQDHAYYEARVAPALSQIAATYDRLVALKAPVRAFEDSWRQLKAKLPDLFALLHTSCAKNEGYMDRYVRRKVQVVGRTGGASEKGQVETVRFGKVPAPNAFIARAALLEIDKAVGRLRTAKLILERATDTKARRQAFTELAHGRKSAEGIARQLSGYASNSDPSWWPNAVRFALAEGTMGNLAIHHRKLIITTRWDGGEAFIPEFGKDVVGKAREMVQHWPSGL